MTAPHAARATARITALDPRRLALVTAYIEANLAESITLQNLADLAAVSPFHFAKRFKAATGVSPYAFVVARRMQYAGLLLQAGRTSVAQAARAVGYSQAGHFRRQFAAHWGRSPADRGGPAASGATHPLGSRGSAPTRPAELPRPDRAPGPSGRRNGPT
jgi:AraC family transcriptional regulator